MVKEYRQIVIERMLAMTKIAKSGCRLWLGKRLPNGYGLWQYRKQSGDYTCTTAHRVMYIMHHGKELPKDVFVCHTCDNPSCVNIDHLFAGNAEANNNDKISKERHAKHYTLHTRTRTIDNNTIAKIKKAKGSLKKVSEKYGVSISYVSKLRNGMAKTLVN